MGSCAGLCASGCLTWNVLSLQKHRRLTLTDANALGEIVVEYYDRMDSETRGLLPLKKIYWPV